MRLLDSTFGSFRSWWDDAESSETVQEYSYYGLGAAYVAIAVVALVQLVRIQLRVPEYGWTTQKVFHLLNGLVAALRAGTFLLRPQLAAVPSVLARLLLLDLPGLLFFTTYTLLVLFWAEIYHQARSLPTGALRPQFTAFNALAYTVQGALWVVQSLDATAELAPRAALLSAVFLAVISLAAAAGFAIYGGRLFVMLQRFPIESKGRRKKLTEVGLVTAVCATCFSLRAILVAAAALDSKDLSLDDTAHPLVNIVYYGVVELLPTAWVLFILRKLPPKRNAEGYTAVPSGPSGEA